jgi:glycyl-radical enzyme activating protein
MISSLGPSFRNPRIGKRPTVARIVRSGMIKRNEGLVFHIIHGSFVDGYGIRTTVFLKGCPLNCVWCCNPEGQNDQAEIKFTSSKCDGCSRCASVCPDNAIQTVLKAGNSQVQIDRRLCTNCGECIQVCYTGALDYFGKRMSVDEVFEIAKKDEQFYRAGGGGVTIGGGEPAFQPLFTRALLKKCRENYIHTAVDTCGYTASSDGLKVLEEADLLLYDLKGINPKQHKENTGVSNKPILDNLRYLDSIDKSIIIRLPIIPGHNDAAEDIRAMAEFLSKLKSVERVDLMGYHEYGTVKYQELGRKYTLRILPISQERLDDIKKTLEQHGLSVQFGG